MDGLRIIEKQMVLDLDLNYPLPTIDDMDDLVDASLSIRPPGNGEAYEMQTHGLDPIDDEVVICSPRSFAEAREKAKRNRRVIEVIDAETHLHRGSSGLSFSGGKNRQRRGSPKHTSISSGLFLNLEANELTKDKRVSDDLEITLGAPAPKRPSFSCPICIGPFVEATSTKCGHIFCKACIHRAIVAQKKCPTCRRKLKLKDTLRVYLPTSD